MIRLCLVCCLLAITSSTLAESIKVAVASNFAPTLRLLVQDFNTQHTRAVKFQISVASTGKLYAQIKQGAPFDVFFAADKHRPELLVEAGLGLESFVYAQGILVLWVPDKQLDQPVFDYLTNAQRKLAMANPKLAPYGLAAKQYLQHQRVWRDLQSNIVRGENVAQTMNFVRTGNAIAGLVSLAQMIHANIPSEQYQFVPSTQYLPIEQQVVRLSERTQAKAFLSYLTSAAAQDIVRDAGYKVASL